jgi:hypothetical protein
MLSLHQVRVNQALLNFSLANFTCVFSKGLSCRYPEIERRAHHERLHPTPPSTRSSTAVKPRQTAATESGPPQNSFPQVFYLDWNVFQQYQVEIPKPTLLLPPNISKVIRGQENRDIIAAEYFTTTHSWMPIISKKSFYANINAPSSQIRADYALLILAMELICWVPEDNNPRTPAYVALKSFYLDLEVQGLVSLQVLQAGILISLFELGHAIFPSAAVSVDACVRYGCALGINWNAKFPAKRPFSWVDLDEQNRVWWAVVILDRYASPGPLKVRTPNLEVRVNLAQPASSYYELEGVALTTT